MENKQHKETTQTQVVDGEIVFPKTNVVSQGYEGIERK